MTDIKIAGVRLKEQDWRGAGWVGPYGPGPASCLRVGHDGLRRSLPAHPGKRYLDWDLPDPKDRPIDEVRSIRDDIATRVIALITELDAGDRPTDEPRFERASARRPYDSAINRLGIPLACRSTHASSAGSPAPPSGLWLSPHTTSNIPIAPARSRSSADRNIAAARRTPASRWLRLRRWQQAHQTNHRRRSCKARSAKGRNTLVQGLNATARRGRRDGAPDTAR